MTEINILDADEGKNEKNELSSSLSSKKKKTGKKKKKRSSSTSSKNSTVLEDAGGKVEGEQTSTGRSSVRSSGKSVNSSGKSSVRSSKKKKSADGSSVKSSGKSSKSKKTTKSTGKSTENGPNVASLQRSKAQYRRGSNSSATRVLPQQRRQPDQGASPPVVRPPNQRASSSASQRQEQGPTGNQRAPSQRQQEQAPTPPPAVVNHHQQTRNADPADDERVGAYRVMAWIPGDHVNDDNDNIVATPVVENENEEQENATPNVQPPQTAHVSRLPQENANQNVTPNPSNNPSMTQTANINVNLVTMLPQGDRANDSESVLSYYLGDEEEGRNDQEQPKRAKTAKQSNFRLIVGALLCCIVVALVITVVLVFAVGGDSGSNDTGPLKPGTIACQEDEVCQDSEEHMGYWNATGCMGILDCEADFTPEEIAGNETLQEACNSTLEAGTQECHDNIICKRQESHVKLIVDGVFENMDGDVGVCERTPGPTPAPVPVTTDAIIVETDEFYTDSPNDSTGACPVVNDLQTTMIGLSCTGESCSNLTMTCHNSANLQIDSRFWRSHWSQWSFHLVGQDVGACPYPNSVITMLKCGTNTPICSNTKVFCQELISVTLDYNNCSETTIFPSAVDQTDYEEIPAGTYAVGVRCSDRLLCGQKIIRYCYPLAPGSAATEDDHGIAVKTEEFHTLDKNSGHLGPEIGECPVIDGLQTVMTGLACREDFCASLTMFCHNSGSLQVGSTLWESDWFSQEEGGFMQCPSRDTVITRMQCGRWRCSRLKLWCQELSSIKLDYNNCSNTALIPSAFATDDYQKIPDNAYAVGMQCFDHACSLKYIHYCYPLASGIADHGGIIVQTDKFTNSLAVPVIGECPNTTGLQTTMVGLRCAGEYCSNVQMACSNSGTLQLDSTLWESDWLSWFDNGDDIRRKAECPLNSVITQLGCRNSGCPRLQLGCQELISVALDHNNCSETPIFPTVVNQTDYEEIPAGAYAVGLRCNEEIGCAQKAIRYCYPVTPVSGGDDDDDTIIVWTDDFTGFNAPHVHGECPVIDGLQTTMIGLRCSGESCSYLTMTCHNSGTLEVDNDIWSSEWFSDLPGRPSAECPQNSVITQLGCMSDRCDYHQLGCQELVSVTLDYNNCSETAIFPSAVGQSGYREIPAGAFAVGMRCQDVGYCGQKSIRFCYPLAAGDD